MTQQGCFRVAEITPQNISAVVFWSAVFIGGSTGKAFAETCHDIPVEYTITKESTEASISMDIDVDALAVSTHFLRTTGEEIDFDYTSTRTYSSIERLVADHTEYGTDWYSSESFDVRDFPDNYDFPYEYSQTFNSDGLIVKSLIIDRSWEYLRDTRETHWIEHDETGRPTLGIYRSERDSLELSYTQVCLGMVNQKEFDDENRVVFSSITHPVNRGCMFYGGNERFSNKDYRKSFYNEFGMPIKEEFYSTADFSGEPEGVLEINYDYTLFEQVCAP